MMLLQSWLWFIFVSKYFPSRALLLMDSEQNYTPPESKDVTLDTVNNNNDSSEAQNSFLNPCSSFNSHQSKSHLLVPSYNGASMDTFASSCEAQKSSS